MAFNISQWLVAVQTPELHAAVAATGGHHRVPIIHPEVGGNSCENEGQDSEPHLCLGVETDGPNLCAVAP